MSQDELDEYYRHYFRGNRLYGELAKLLGETVQTLFLMRLLLDKEEGLCQSEICENLSVPKQTMSRVLKDMEGKGLVRNAPSPRDGREKLFSLTASGRAHAQAVVERLNAIENACLSGLSDEMKAINKLNEQYLDRLQDCIEQERDA